VQSYASDRRRHPAAPRSTRVGAATCSLLATEHCSAGTKAHTTQLRHLFVRTVCVPLTVQLRLYSLQRSVTCEPKRMLSTHSTPSMSEWSWLATSYL
jgi:hypothetical protein